MNRNKKIIRTSVLGVLLNAFLVAVKLIIGFISSSIAIILDGVNNLSDSMSSIINIIGTKLSNKAPDKKHPYGHGRIEYFTSVIISTIVLVVGVFAMKEAINKIINPVEPEYSVLFIILIAVGVIIKFIYGNYVKKVGKSLNSHALIATGTDSLMDSVLSFSTLLGAITTYLWDINVDGYLGVLISIIIIRTAFVLLSETTSLLIGERADSKLTSKLKKKILEYDEIKGAYDLYLHYYGPSKIIGSVHIEVRNDMTAEEIHILTRKIEYEIFSDYGIILTIGIYALNDKGEFKELKKDIEEVIKEYPSVSQLHGFYVDKTKNIVYFDLIVDFAEEEKDKIIQSIKKELKSKYKDYHFYVTIDSDVAD